MIVACLSGRSRSSTLRASTALARLVDSWSSRHSVFSRSGTSRRRQSRSMRERETALVASLCSRCRSAERGSVGPAQWCVSAHQASQEPTGARLRFHVAGFASPHSCASASAIHCC
ncbi:hypothetical protein BJF78_34260 [Pseudonocardia sp. CNS-139]|nr:hypothetical protein BJF78_34260 [Pseudonocardia sp. CNS-139]